MTTFHEIETALRELTRDDWEAVAKSVVADTREPVPNAAEEARLWAEGYLD